MTQAAHRPFVFDTEFDDAGVVITPSTWRPTKHAYLPAEVEALVAHARLEAREAALAEAGALRDMALSEIGRAVGQALPALARSAAAHRAATVELCLASARVIAGAALERMPDAPLRAALESLGQEIDASPRLVLRAPGLDAEGRARLEAVCAEAGFTGQVSFRDAPEMPVAAFSLEWADGRADFDPAEAAQRIGQTLSDVLAAEGGHAEALDPHDDHGVF